MNNKSKVNPFKFVNGKMITVHQSKEGSTKIGEVPIKTESKYESFFKNAPEKIREYYTDKKIEEDLKDDAESLKGYYTEAFKNFPEQRTYYELLYNIKTKGVDETRKHYDRIMNKEKNNNDKTTQETEVKPNIEQKDLTDLGISPEVKVIQIEKPKEVSPVVENKIVTQPSNNTPKLTELEQTRERARQLGQIQEVERIDRQIEAQGKYLNENKPKETKEEVKKVEEIKQENTIPDLSKYDFNTAFGKAKQLSDIGQFKWKGGVYGTALNTKSDLGKYDDKYKTKFSNQYTGSGIAGEMYGNKQTAVPVNSGIPSKGVNPTITPTERNKYDFVDYEDYSAKWDNAKTKSEKKLLTMQARLQGLTNQKGNVFNTKKEETPKSVANPFTGSIFDVNREGSKQNTKGENKNISLEIPKGYRRITGDKNQDLSQVSSSMEIRDKSWINSNIGSVYSKDGRYYQILGANESFRKDDPKATYKLRYLDKDLESDPETKKQITFQNNSNYPKTYPNTRVEDNKQSIEEKISKGRIEGNWKKHLNTEDVKMLKLRASLQKNINGYNAQFPFLDPLEFKELQSYKAQGGIINPFIPKADNGMLLDKPKGLFQGLDNTVGQYDSSLLPHSTLEINPNVKAPSKGMGNITQQMDWTTGNDDFIADELDEVVIKPQDEDPQNKFPQLPSPQLPSLQRPEFPKLQIPDSVPEGVKKEKRSGIGDFIKRNTKGVDMFDVVNTANMVKGFMGRNIKPPKRSFEDRQDIIAPAQGMNPFQKQDSLNNLQSQANIAQMNNKTIDPRLNTAAMLGIQQNTNQGLNQLNSQDSQMYNQDQQRMMGQKQNENMRMLQGQQNFQAKIQDENMRNYQMQQQAAQQSINQGLNNMQMKQRDNQNQRLQKQANDDLMTANFYGKAMGSLQNNVKINKLGDKDFQVSYYDKEGLKTKNFTDVNQAEAFRSTMSTHDDLDEHALNQSGKMAQGFLNLQNRMRRRENGGLLKKGGKITESNMSPEDRRIINNAINPFKYNNVYTNELLRYSKSLANKNIEIRHKINRSK